MAMGYDLEALRMQVMAQRSEIERLRTALEFYADHNTYCGERPDAQIDFGSRARAALKQPPQTIG